MNAVSCRAPDYAEACDFLGLDPMNPALRNGLPAPIPPGEEVCGATSSRQYLNVDKRKLGMGSLCTIAYLRGFWLWPTSMRKTLCNMWNTIDIYIKGHFHLDDAYPLTRFICGRKFA